MARAVKIELTAEEKAQLEAPLRSARSEVRDVQRARIVMEAAEGKSNREIAENVGVSLPTVSLWRRRFAEERLSGLKERPGRGRRRVYSEEKVVEIVEATLHTTPENATHWSTRTMAEAQDVSHSTVRRIWNAHRIKPHLVRTFKLSNDPQFVEKLRDVVGLYLNPPEHAVVFSVDEKSQIQALDRTQPGLPLEKGRLGTTTHDYRRHGTATLFAALNVLDGTVIGRCMPRHRHEECLKFLRVLDRETPKELDIHLIVDHYATHKHANVKAWLKKHPRFHVHFIPTSSSWLNLVERFFREITDKRIRRSVFSSVLELTQAIDAFLEAVNADPKPFVWTKTPDKILEKLTRLRANLAP